MNYEKKYNELIEAIKILRDINPSDEGIQNWISDNFPELKESEDEKIRKTLITFHKNTTVCIGDIKGDEIVSWLEKQGESDETKAKIFLINKGYPIDANGVFPTYDEMYNIIKEGLEKQGEKSQGKAVLEAWKEWKEKKVNNVNKVEHKFNVGDWITNGLCKCQITFIDSRYWYSETCVLGNTKDIDKTFHLWTIADARPGDVLVHNGCTFIFMGIKDGIVQAIETTMLGLVNFGEPDKDTDYFPATKEQRELLFSKIKEAGYEWDDEKKQLNKI